MQVDQFREYTDEEISALKACNLLYELVSDEDGRFILADDLKRVEAKLSHLQGKGVTLSLTEKSEKLLQSFETKCDEVIKENQETRKLMKQWWWWLIGTMAAAWAVVAVCICAAIN